ncbi:hypothetical protein DS885_00390 [Psychromonas sp. B3M02]|uniref:hypothetical protein n=1 Tax=unclassified Psychromonas TaxID=2614957 RepID=UPI000DEB5B2F|nr:hypothetical protein [Psychromonas sp. B3M02]RBW47941.1 hypothetical protein DS885_00390 [Psychromonas sp. B3M02]
MTNNNEPVCDENKISDEAKSDNLFDTEQIEQKFNEVSSMFNKLSDTIDALGKWSESTIQVFFMELLRSIAASKQFLLCQVLFIPLLILFVFSTCIAIGIVFYSLTGYLLVGVGTSLLSMLLVLAGLAYWQKRLMKMIGFTDTIAQIKEGIDVVSKASKSLD